MVFISFKVSSTLFHHHIQFFSSYETHIFLVVIYDKTKCRSLGELWKRSTVRNKYTRGQLLLLKTHREVDVFLKRKEKAAKYEKMNKILQSA